MKGGSALLLVGGNSFAESKPLVRVGLVTDLHHADKDPRGSRHYRESLGKLDEAKKLFTEFDPDFVVELGDLIDAADLVPFDDCIA